MRKNLGDTSFPHSAPAPGTKPDLLSVPQAAAQLGVSAKRVYELASSGQLRAQRVGGRVWVPAESVRLLIDARSLPSRSKGAAIHQFSPLVVKEARSALSRLVGDPRLFRLALNGRLPLTEPRLKLSEKVQEAVAGILGSSDLDSGDAVTALHALGTPSPSSVLPETPTAILREVPVIDFLTYQVGLLRNQALFIYGPPGSLKTRVASTLAVLCATEVPNSIVLYYGVEANPERLSRLLSDTANAWGSEVPVHCLDSLPVGSINSGIIVCGLPNDWKRLEDEIDEFLLEFGNISCIVIDSIGPFPGEVERETMDRILSRLSRERMVVLIGEEPTAEPLPSFQHLIWLADLTIRLGFDFPQQEFGVITRFIEILKSRNQRCREGRHELGIGEDGRAFIAPAIQSLATYPELPMPEGKVPGFGLPAIDKAIESVWTNGGLAALRGPVGCYKLLLSLHAIAATLREGQSILVVSPVVGNPIGRFGKILADFRALHGFAPEQVRPLHYHMIGSPIVLDKPQVLLLPIEGDVSADRVLWNVAETVRCCRDNGHPIGLVVFPNLPEICLLPKFRSAVLFPLMIARLIKRLNIRGLVTVDEETWQRYLTATASVDILQFIHLLIRLSPNPPHGDVTAVTSDYDTLRLKIIRDPSTTEGKVLSCDPWDVEPG